MNLKHVIDRTFQWFFVLVIFAIALAISWVVGDIIDSVSVAWGQAYNPEYKPGCYTIRKECPEKTLLAISTLNGQWKCIDLSEYHAGYWVTFEESVAKGEIILCLDEKEDLALGDKPKETGICWEYKKERYSSIEPITHKQLQFLGNEGWELVAVQPTEKVLDAIYYGYFVFKRPIPCKEER